MSDRETAAAVARIRSAVRRGRPYIVGGRESITVKLNQNECPFDIPEELKRALMEAYFATPFNRYPEEQPWELCQAIASHVGWDPKGVLVGNGSSELMFTIGITILSAGDHVVMPRPMFAFYESMVALFEGALVSVGPRADLSFDAQALLRAIQRVQPVLVVLTTPNNPTGLAMPVREVEAIVKTAPGFVVVDEAYIEFSEEESALTLLPQYPHLLLLRTFSKAVGLAGLRLGYILGHAEVMAEILKARVPFMVDRLAERAALMLLERPALLAERVSFLKRETMRLHDALSALEGVDAVRSQTNFVLFRTKVEPALLLDRLARHGVLVRNVSGYEELPGFVRVTAGAESENKAFLVALQSVLRLEDLEA